MSRRDKNKQKNKNTKFYLHSFVSARIFLGCFNLMVFHVQAGDVDIQNTLLLLCELFWSLAFI